MGLPQIEVDRLESSAIALTVRLPYGIEMAHHAGRHRQPGDSTPHFTQRHPQARAPESPTMNQHARGLAATGTRLDDADVAAHAALRVPPLQVKAPQGFRPLIG